MEGFLTPDQISARTSRALAAAVAAGRDLGLDVADARVLYDVFSVVVHLAPSPVVVRVPTVLPSYADADSQAARQRHELDVVGWLADHGHPVIPPSPLVTREPVTRDGFSMTFWQFVELDQSAQPDYVRHAGLVADLHAALRSYPGELPFLSAAEPRFVTEGLAALEGRPDLLDPADLDRARREWEVLEPVVGSRAGFEAVFPGVGFQPIHGDAPAANIVSGPDGVLYSDFELTTLGSGVRSSRRNIDGFGDHVPSIPRKLLKCLLAARWPADDQAIDNLVAAQTKMQDRLARRHVSTSKYKLAHLLTCGCFDSHCRSHPEPIGSRSAQRDDDTVTIATIVAADGRLALVINEDDIKISIPVEIAECRAETHARVIQSPRGARILKF